MQILNILSIHLPDKEHSMRQDFNLLKPLTAWPGGLSFFQCVDLNGGVLTILIWL